LVNRGGRELPIAPQIVAADIPLDASQHMQLTKLTDGTLVLELTQHKSARTQEHE
jgi:pyrimidine operon attenuation protein/uracil phosphoribosyltransferase